jgi:hypothetical protein
VAWAREQSVELLANGVPGIHFYIMSTAKNVVRVIDGLR